MKTNKILLLIFIGLSLSSFSQKVIPISKGNYFIESNFNGRFIGGVEKHGVLNIRPSAGFFLEDKWAIGITSRLDFYNLKLNQDNTNNKLIHAKSTQTEIGFFTQYYLLSGLYAKLSTTAGMIHETYTDHPNANKFSYTISPAIGYDLFLGKKKKVALGVSISYDFSNIENAFGKIEYPTPLMHNCSGFKFNFSVKYILGKKK